VKIRRNTLIWHYLDRSATNWHRPPPRNAPSKLTKAGSDDGVRLVRTPEWGEYLIEVEHVRRRKK
jgi:hypothetical protein